MTGSYQRLTQQRRELFGFFQKAVVSVRRIDNLKLGRTAQSSLQLEQIGQRHQPIRRKADQRYRHGNIFWSDFVQVDRLGQGEESIGIEALDEAEALVFEVVLDRKMEALVAELSDSSEALAEFGAAAIGGDRQLTCQRERLADLAASLA